MLRRRPTNWQECIAEIVGTFILVFFGLGAVHTAVLWGAPSGIWQVAIVWGAAVSMAIYAVGAISGAHLNPAITLALVVFRRFPRRKIAPYFASQLIGAFAAAATLFVLLGPAVAQFEATAGITRGGAGSQRTAMLYACYFPNPDLHGVAAQSFARLSHSAAVVAEVIGTAALALLVFMATDLRNPMRPRGAAVPVVIGLGLAMIIAVIGPITMAGLNPARDLGPRVLAWLAGWGTVALPGPRGGFFTVYILAPFVGALLGGGLYHHVLRTAFPLPKVQD